MAQRVTNSWIHLQRVTGSLVLRAYGCWDLLLGCAVYHQDLPLLLETWLYSEFPVTPGGAGGHQGESLWHMEGLGKGFEIKVGEGKGGKARRGLGLAESRRGDVF